MAGDNMGGRFAKDAVETSYKQLRNAGQDDRRFELARKYIFFFSSSHLYGKMIV